MAPNVDKIGIVGTGDIGSVIAGLAAGAGMEVFLSNSRGPESLTELSADLGPKAHACSVDGAATSAELVVIAIPFARFLDLPADSFDGRLVIDATNYIPFRDTEVSELVGEASTPSELLAQHLKGAKIIKAFNNIYSGHLKNLSRSPGAADRSALPIAGDDVPGKALVTDFLDRIGWDAVDAGSLANSSLFKVGQPAFVHPYLLDQSGTDQEWGARLGSDPGAQLSREQLQLLLKMAN